MKIQISLSAITRSWKTSKVNAFSHTKKVREVSRERRTLLAGMFSSSCFALTKTAAPYFDPMTPLQQRVQTQLDLGVSDGLTLGAVMMAVQREKVCALEAAGYSDLAAKKPMKADAIFDIRSLRKPIAVLGALLLVDDGKLTLDDPLAKSLPEFSHLTVKGQAQPTNVPITLRQLMMHTSGIADERPPALENITRTFDLTLAEDAALVAQQPLDFIPGSRWAYSSSGIAVLGRVCRSGVRSVLPDIHTTAVTWTTRNAGQLFLYKSRESGSHPYDVQPGERPPRKRCDGCHPSGSKILRARVRPVFDGGGLTSPRPDDVEPWLMEEPEVAFVQLGGRDDAPCVANVRPQISCRSRMGHSYGKRAGNELRRHRRRLWSKRGQRRHPLDRSEHTTHSYLPDTLLLGRFLRGESGDERRISWIGFPGITCMPQTTP